MLRRRAHRFVSIRGKTFVGLATMAISLWTAGLTSAAEFAGSTGVLPAGTELGEDALERPREIFRSEARGGRQSYLVTLGDVAFNSPSLLGTVARQAGISCNTCHVNGTTNPRLYIPGSATRPGNFDTTGPLFNPKSDNGVLDPLTAPSLRGARELAPYGHDGRSPSLREFLRNVIVTEFAGDEPAHEILDALVVYVEDIDFVPNRRLAPGGTLTGPASEAEKRGEMLFYRPFTHNPHLSCATCHVPDQAFVDHQQHDIGSGGRFKTPTLLNANYNAPYFHDGRYDSYSQVVAYFDRVFYLGLSSQDRQDLVAYLAAVGGGEQALLPDDVDTHVKEIINFAKVLDVALPERNAPVATLTLDTIDRELRELTECFPDRKDPTLKEGVNERIAARGSLKILVLSLHEISTAVQGARFDEAMAGLGHYRRLLESSVSTLKAAEPWSLFNRETHDAHFAALRQVYKAAIDPTSRAQLRLDRD
jgi:cytochrome c peroxidase